MIVGMQSYSNIIVRMPNWIGDLVMATPVLFALKKAYPHAKLTAMVKNPLGDLLVKDPHIDELFRFNKASGFARRDDRRSIVEKIRQGKYDLGILLANSFSSAWWFWQGKIPRRIGYSMHCRSFLLTDSVPLPVNLEKQHHVLTFQQLLQPLEIETTGRRPELFLSADELQVAKKTLKDLGVDPNAPLVGINPGAAYGSAKCWLPDRFREVTLKILEKTDATVLYFGDRAGAVLVKEITQGMPGRVVNLAGGTSLRELIAFISLCDVLLTNDSGPMHIAAACNTDVVALFGSTSEIATGPYKMGTVIHKHVRCSPCFKRICPIDFRCMKQITSEEVIQALLASLKTKNPKLAIV